MICYTRDGHDRDTRNQHGIDDYVHERDVWYNSPILFPQRLFEPTVFLRKEEQPLSQSIHRKYLPYRDELCDDVNHDNGDRYCGDNHSFYNRNPFNLHCLLNWNYLNCLLSFFSF